MSAPGLPPPPGWYADPHAAGWRWWDGMQWTDHAAPAQPAAPVSQPGPIGTPLPPRPAPGVRRYESKPWHVPLIIAVAVAWTAIGIVIQVLLD